MGGDRPLAQCLCAFSEEAKRAVPDPERTHKPSVFLFVESKPQGSREHRRMTACQWERWGSLSLCLRTLDLSGLFKYRGLYLKALLVACARRRNSALEARWPVPQSPCLPSSVSPLKRRAWGHFRGQNISVGHGAPSPPLSLPADLPAHGGRGV